MKKLNIISKWTVQTGCFLLVAAATIPAPVNQSRAPGENAPEHEASTLPFAEGREESPKTVPFNGSKVEPQTLPRAFGTVAKEINLNISIKH